jgi:hypothetical protein
VVFSIGDGTIRLIEDVTAVDDKEGLRHFHDQVLGRRDPSQTGPSVFTWLADRVLATDRDEG